MTYREAEGGRFGRDGSGDGSVGETPVFWTFDMVEARLIEAVEVRRRMPGGGRWPFAKDGPWHLIPEAARAETVADFLLDAALMGHEDRFSAPSRAEIAAMEEAEGWTLFVGDEGQRQALAAGIVERAKGAKRVGWTRLCERLSFPHAPAAMERRFARAVTTIANVLNALAGHGYRTRKGALAQWPAEVRAMVERVRAEEVGRLSSPG